MPWPSSLAAWIQGALHLSLPKQGRWHRSAIAAFQADAPFQLQGSSQPLPSLGHPASRGFGCQSRSPMEPPSGPPALVPGGDRGCHLAGAAGAVGDSSPRQSQRLPSLRFFGWFRNQDSESRSSCVTSAPGPLWVKRPFPVNQGDRIPSFWPSENSGLRVVAPSFSRPLPHTLSLCKQTANLVPQTRQMKGGAVEARKAEIRSEQQDHFLGIVNPEL